MNNIDTSAEAVDRSRDLLRRYWGGAWGLSDDLATELASVLAERDAARAEVERLREALRPFARINDEYEASNLDEHRPEWPSRDPGEVDLLVGRGGKRLLTLADCMTAYDALAGAAKMGDAPFWMTVYALNRPPRRALFVWREEDCGCGGSYHRSCGNVVPVEVDKGGEDD